METLEVAQRVAEEIEGFEYTSPPDGLIGEPWPESRLRQQLAVLRAALVPPRRRLFRDLDKPSDPHDAYYWVVAIEDQFIVFFDEEDQNFGLALGDDDSTPETIGVRGDLLGVFAAR